MTVFAAVSDLLSLRTRYAEIRTTFQIGFHFRIEQLHIMLSEEGPQGGTVHIIFENRGRREDRELELEVHRIAVNNVRLVHDWQGFGLFDFQPVVVPKAANSTGLQLADLTVRSTALLHLRPNQLDCAFESVRLKFGRSAQLACVLEAGKADGAQRFRNSSVDRAIPNPITNGWAPSAQTAG